MFPHAHSVGSKVVIASAGFLGLPHLRSEIVFNSDIHELSLSTPPHGVIIEAYAGVNISRSSTQCAPLEILVGDHQLASVAQHEDRTKEALQNCENVVMARNAKKIKQVCPLSLPSSSSFIISSRCIKSKVKATSHRSSPSSLTFSSNNKQTTFHQIFASFPKASSRATPDQQTTSTGQYQATSSRGALLRNHN